MYFFSRFERTRGENNQIFRNIDSKNRSDYKKHLLTVHGEEIYKKLEGSRRINPNTSNKQESKDLPKSVHEDTNHKENTGTVVDNSKVHESKKPGNIDKPVNEDINQKGNTIINEVIENQKPKNVQNKEKTETDVDSSIVHEEKKPVNEAEVLRNNCTKNKCKYCEKKILNFKHLLEHICVEGRKCPIC